MRITRKYNKSISGDLIGDIRLLIETARVTISIWPFFTAISATVSAMIFWRKKWQDMVKKFCLHCPQNWFRNLVMGLVSEIYQGWFDLPKFFLKGRLYLTLSRQLSHFVEKDAENATRLYPLSDYKPRKGEALQKGYLYGRYGALPFPGELRFWWVPTTCFTPVHSTVEYLRDLKKQ